MGGGIGLRWENQGVKLIFTTFIVYFYIKKLIENLDIKKLNNVIIVAYQTHP